MNNEPLIRWGIIGVGRFGRVHARALKVIPGCKLVAICQRNEERLASAAAELGIDRTYLHHRDLLADPEIDAVSITTHWQEHFITARDALQSGKHVLLEKPMAATIEQCRELLSISREAAGILMVSCFYALRESRSMAERARARTVLYGAMVLPLIPTVIVARGTSDLSDLFTSYLWVSAVVMPLPVGLAISRYNLFDLGTDVRRWIGKLVYFATVSFVAAVFLVATATSYLIVGRIVEPVSEISQAVDAMAKGDYRQRLYVTNRDELGELAAKLNRVCQDLDTRLAQISQSHERQASVLGGMIEGVIAVDRRERVVFANSAAGRLFDFRPGMVEGRRLLEVVRNHALDAAVGAALATGEPQRLETKQEGGEMMSVAIQATPLPGMYLPPNAPFQRRRSLNALIHEAERAVKAEDARQLLEEWE